MKKTFIAPLATALIVSISSAHGALVVNFTGFGGQNSQGTASESVTLTGITSSTVTAADTFTPGDVVATATDFDGTGSLSIAFSAGNTFDEATWTLANTDSAIFSSNNNTGRRGLGVHTDADGTILNAVRSLNADEAIVFSIDASGLTTGNILQFRLIYGTSSSSGTFSLFEQTGATTGALLQTVTTDQVSPISGDAGTNTGLTAWYDVDGLATYAVSDATQGNIQGIEFSVVPEPSSLALLGLGLGTLCLRRRK